MINKTEIQNETTAPTKLWERSQFATNKHSRFGLCLVNTDKTDPLFKNAEIYQPDYFPKDTSIDIITNNHQPQLPWTFRLPYRNEKKIHNEPIVHSNGIKKLTRTEFEFNAAIENSPFINHFDSESQILFTTDNRNYLKLEFDNNIQGKTKQFSSLNLSLSY